jgi:uncharacterized protein YndB with AHSA1/START domain
MPQDACNKYSFPLLKVGKIIIDYCSSYCKPFTTFMKHYKFTTEFEFRASRKMLFPYISTASGLSQWFADNVNIDEDKNYHFFWDGESQKARLSAQRTNSYVRFEMLEEETEAPFIELRLEEDELTDSTFLKITDCTSDDDEEEQQDIWENMITTLKETVGG